MKQTWRCFLPGPTQIGHKHRWRNILNQSSSQTAILINYHLMHVYIPTRFESNYPKSTTMCPVILFLKFEVKYGWLHDKRVKNFNDNMPSGRLHQTTDYTTRRRKPMTAFHLDAPTQHKFDGRSSRPWDSSTPWSSNSCPSFVGQCGLPHSKNFHPSHRIF